MMLLLHHDVNSYDDKIPAIQMNLTDLGIIKNEPLLVASDEDTVAKDAT